MVPRGRYQAQAVDHSTEVSEMSESNPLAQMANFLYGAGTPMAGLGLSPEEASREAQRRYPNKPHCLVRQWMLVDLLMAYPAQWAAEHPGMAPRLVFAHNIVFDSAGRFAPGYWVRSTFEVSYTAQGFFETGNTVYVLLGEGCSKAETLEVVFSLY